jgi:hypothetical protein
MIFLFWVKLEEKRERWKEEQWQPDFKIRTMATSFEIWRKRERWKEEWEKRNIISY